MKIAKIDTIPLEIPFRFGGQPAGWGGKPWTTLATLLVRVETDEGLVGWGDAFAYVCRRPVQAAVAEMVAPLALGQDARDIRGLSRRLQQELHLFGRYGITLFALSGLDIALWDIAGKAAGRPLHVLLGGAARSRMPGYASLFRYGDPDLVAERCRRALAEGYPAIKLHETGEAEVAAAREAVGDALPIMLDTNCPWTPNEARANALRLAPYGLHWLEEPIFPPEDFAALAWLHRETGVPLAAGENACTAFEFKKMLDAGALAYLQPSVTKVGGVTEFLKIAALAEAAGTGVMPHSPYFGPGFLATLQLVAILPAEGWVERFHLDVEASLYGDLIDPVDGCFRVPDGPGLGRDPDPEVIKDYRVSD